MNNTPQITDGMWNGLVGKFLYAPILNLLVFLYTIIPGQDLGLAIIALTAIVRLILHPSYRKSLTAQRDMQRIQPYIEKVKEEHKDDPQAQSQAIMQVYKEHKISPLGSCLPLIIQLPILLALYRVFIAGLNQDSLRHLYAWFPNPPSELHTTFLAFLNIPSLTINLAEPSLLLAIIAGVAQLWQTWITQSNNKGMAQNPMMKSQAMLMYLFPIVTVFIGLTLPAALALYWIASTSIMAIEQILIYRKIRFQEQRLIETTHAQ